jgi:ribosomal protein S12 methylthiotransferase
MQKSPRKINVVTLGCSKNIVDSEYLMRQLEVDGWQVLHDSNDPSAEVVVINTCGFIADAKEESIDTILDFIEAKRKGLISKVFVMGCLSQRYKAELEKEIPEVDGYFGVSQLGEMLKSLDTPFSNANKNTRLLSTPKHYAYLKISEGCSWGCSFCAIPLIRGKHISKPIPELIEQAQWLANKGVKELIIIGQDTTYYGKDIYGMRKLPELLTKISEVNGIEWIRIHYTYPTGFPLDLLSLLQGNSKVCKYLDIPFQHISDRMLKTMRRGISKRQTLELIEKIRKNVPDIALRTTLLVGHPGETETDFEELIDFVKTVRFERLGVFAYSNEEGTNSAKLTDNTSESIKQQRVEQIMSIQQEISLQNNYNRIGKTYKVIIDRVEGSQLIGRTEFDSPEVDQEVIIQKPHGEAIKPGTFVLCRITSAEEFDLIGEIVKDIKKHK